MADDEPKKRGGSKPGRRGPYVTRNDPPDSKPTKPPAGDRTQRRGPQKDDQYR
jgi:hypothetical protein